MLLKDFVPFPKNPNIAQIFTQMGRSEEFWEQVSEKSISIQRSIPEVMTLNFLKKTFLQLKYLWVIYLQSKITQIRSPIK